MRIRDRSARLTSRLRHPKTTVRWRLTLLYGGLFLISGGALLAITYTLVDRATTHNSPFAQVTRVVGGQQRPSSIARPVPGGGPKTFVRKQGTVPPPVRQLLLSKSGREAVIFLGSSQRVSDLHQLVIESSIALAIMAVISTFLGWVVAGRVLSPLRTMTATTQQITAANLHERLAVKGPPDELRQLADTIDDLLGRLEGAFDAQRRFVANASHELRTPLTAARLLLEMAISDPAATVESFRSTCRQVLEESEHQEQLIDALLTLAQGQRGIDRPVPVDLTAVVRDVVQGHQPEAAALHLSIESSLDPGVLPGDPRLIERLASNLLDNALHHNFPNGHVWVEVCSQAGRTRLTVSNTGPQVPADQVGRLLQPFQRLEPERVGHNGGLGLGLSIVAAIADAHGATLQIATRPEGGLDVAVNFPSVSTGDDPVGPESVHDPEAEPIAAKPV
ncbi:MAG: HAMP domain-containing sensor histidine kinase [Solirubrobacteraceae bacterium]